MAAKAPAKSKAAVAKTVKKSKTSSGLAKMTAAQTSAYQAASKTAMQKAQLQHNAVTLQQRRLQGAAKATGKLRQKRAQTIQARIGRNAVSATYKQIVYAHQSKTLRLQAAASLFKHAQVAQNRQFAYLGEALHSRTTTLQTLTSGQALSLEARYVAAARKTALRKNKPAKGGVSKSRTSKSPYAAIGRSAGIQAAARVPASKTRKAAGMGLIEKSPDRAWITAGNDLGEENCVAVAIANSLLYHTGYRVTDGQIIALDYDDFSTALYHLWVWKLWAPQASLYDYREVPVHEVRPGMIVGFETENGPHCGVLMPGHKVVSWGEVVPLEAEIEEAWVCEWRVQKQYGRL